MKRDQPEQRLQRAVVSYLTVALPPDAAWSAIGHGGGGRLRGAVLNGMGVKAGVPDMMIAYRSRVLMIELKSKDGRVSAEQRAFHARLLRAGIETRICRTIGDVVNALTLMGVPLSAKIAA